MRTGDINPRKVEPKAVRRWLKGGLTLTYNAPVSWAFWSLLCSLLIVLLGFSPFLSDLVFYSFLLTGFGLASWIDKGKTRSNYETLTVFFMNLGNGFKYGLITVSLLLVIKASLTPFMDSTITSLFYDSKHELPNAADGAAAFLFSVANSVHLSNVMLIMATALPLFTHPFGVGSMLLYDANFKQATGLVIDGVGKNIDATTNLIFVFLVLGVLLTIILPVLTVLVLLPIMSSTLWVAFKDIFNRESTVKEQEKVVSFDIKLLPENSTAE